MIVLLENKLDGTLSFQQMNFWMAMEESILGGYIGQIVYSFFKKED
ncbi:hypothetical protein N9157_01960 [Saprospiraceae bacterium]|nr:hypothetical protein [Saprospiraceae bacterium]